MVNLSVNYLIMQSDIFFIVQARLGSTRLPNKILLPFLGQDCILDLLVKKLLSISSNVIVATSTDCKNDPLEKKAIEYGVHCFRGSENDVLQRFIDAANYYSANRIIRVCSDNPFLDVNAIKKLISYVNDEDVYDYVSFRVNGNPSIKTHYGFWTEYVTLEALKKVSSLTCDSLYHEHVTNFIYTHPEQFNISWLPVSRLVEAREQVRLTIDTEADFESAKCIYKDLCTNNPYPSSEEVIAYLDSHRAYYQVMQEQIRNNSK